MPSWLKQATYLASTLAGVAAAAFPPYAIYLIPLSTFLAGFATTHPSDALATQPDPNAVAKLVEEIKAVQAANAAKKVEVKQ